MFPAVSGRPKVLAEISGANHFEPTGFGPNRLSVAEAQFFVCVINKDADSCAAIDGLCSSGVPFSSCTVTQ